MLYAPRLPSRYAQRLARFKNLANVKRYCAEGESSYVLEFLFLARYNYNYRTCILGASATGCCVARVAGSANTERALMSEDLDGAEYLEGLLRSLDETIRMNYGILDDKAGLEKLQRDAELRKKRELKERVRSLLGRHERDDEMLPLWRHRLKGVHDPPARLVLKGASLLRVIVQSLILLVIKPHKHILNRKLGSRKAEKQFLHKNLLLYTTSLDHFVCRCVRIPLMSLMDDSLDLEFKPQSRFDLTNARNKRNVLQLKVRVKGVVRALAASTVDGEIIDKLLVCLAQDGNYYKKDFLFQCERAQLEFDSLGGSKNVCLQIDDAPLPVRPSVVKIGDAYFDIARVKMLMLNFVLVRCAALASTCVDAQRLLSPLSLLTLLSL